MRCKAAVLGLVVIPFLGTGSGADDTCQYVHVIDECSAYLKVYEVGSNLLSKEFDLRDGGSNALSSVTFATVAGYEHKVSFVTQGAYLRIVDHDRPGVLRTIDVAAATGHPDLILQGSDSAPALYLDPSAATQYALYLVGNAHGEPRYIVFDQEALLDGETPSNALLGHGRLCVSGGCSGTAIDIIAGSAPAGDVAEEAYASVLAFDREGQRRQRFLRLTRDAAATGPWTVSLESYNEGVVWDSSQHRNLGLAFDHLDEYPTGVFQTERRVADLVTGEQSCSFGFGPTDVALWGPFTGIAMDHLQFVIYNTPGGGELAISPRMECAASSGPTQPLSAKESVPEKPAVVEISAPGQPEFWVYVGSWHASAVKALRYRIVNDENGERLELLASFVLGNGRQCHAVGCAEHLAIGAPVPPGERCLPDALDECPGQTEPPIPCCLDEDDPDPRCLNCNFGGIFDGGGDGGGGIIIP